MNTVQQFGNLWDYAASVHKMKQKDRENNCVESTMFFIGSRQAGKTSIISKFLERSDHPKPSVALEYSFGRRSILGAGSDVCHIYELAGGTTFKKMVSIPINSRSVMSLVVILVLDLSAPDELFVTMDCLLSEVRERLASVMSSTEKSVPGFAATVESGARARIGEQHPDLKVMDVFPVPLLILGTKYDIFRDFEPEHKKIVCRCLRFLAHSHGASLQFVSQHTPDVLGSRVQAILKNGSEGREKPNMDYNTALNISFGEDSFEEIEIFDVPNRASLDIARKACRELMKKTFGEKDIDVRSDDPGRDPNFKEHDIDVVLAQKLKELELENSSRNILRNSDVDI
ncbi:cytoplasmic dynein 2 light intermediate chain 1 [Galendromus occidentalis]|uniref:Cytoplasmic dynein 2 light intermediate chain 1 n=1 Tax=Galendromus occidentalis TaxID=34638 RepID=A0AAJ6QRH9_9ACAR|nr:cytoplasmic dynein 2 light intermediate chain 1 [Galendromus occidentalis]